MAFRARPPEAVLLGLCLLGRTFDHGFTPPKHESQQPFLCHARRIRRVRDLWVDRKSGEDDPSRTTLVKRL